MTQSDAANLTTQELLDAYDHEAQYTIDCDAKVLRAELVRRLDAGDVLAVSHSLEDLVHSVVERRSELRRRVFEALDSESVLGGEPEREGSEATTLDVPFILTADERAR